MILPNFLQITLLALPAAHAATCYGSGSGGFSPSEFQQVANQVCNVGPTARIQFGDSGWPNYYKRIIEATYKGTAKIHCKEAFANIISQCVSAGRNGGQWDYYLGNVQELYTIQANLA